MKTPTISKTKMQHPDSRAKVENEKIEIDKLGYEIVNGRGKIKNWLVETRTKGKMLG
jgi:hypothetical protein